jgi:hypothetical protein
MERGAVLPSACVKCGQPTTAPGLRKTFFSQPSQYLRFIPFPGSLVLLIVALVMGQRMTIEIPLCPRHRRRRMIALIFTFIFCGLGFAAIGIGLNWAINNSNSDADNAQSIILAGIGLLLIGSLCFVCAGRLLSAKQIDADKATFSGAGTRFLQLLPDSPNPRS